MKLKTIEFIEEIVIGVICFGFGIGLGILIK